MCGKHDVRFIYLLSGISDEYKFQKKSIYLKLKYFIRNVFTVNFDQFHVSFLNESIIFFFF